MFLQLYIIVNDYAQVFNRFNACRPLVARLSAGHEPSIRIGWIVGHDMGSQIFLSKILQRIHL